MNVTEIIFWVIHGPKVIMHMFILYFKGKKVYTENSPEDLYVNSTLLQTAYI